MFSNSLLTSCAALRSESVVAATPAKRTACCAFIPWRIPYSRGARKYLSSVQRQQAPWMHLILEGSAAYYFPGTTAFHSWRAPARSLQRRSGHSSESPPLAIVGHSDSASSSASLLATTQVGATLELARE